MFCQPNENLQAKAIFWESPISWNWCAIDTLTMVGHWLGAALWEYGNRSKRIEAGLVHQLHSSSMKSGQFFLTVMRSIYISSLNLPENPMSSRLLSFLFESSKTEALGDKWLCYHHSASNGLEPDWSSKLSCDFNSRHLLCEWVNAPWCHLWKSENRRW